MQALLLLRNYAFWLPSWCFRQPRISNPDIMPLFAFLISCSIIVLYCCFTAYDPTFSPLFLFLKESSASVLKNMRKPKWGGGDIPRSFHKNSRAFKNEWISGLLDLFLFSATPPAFSQFIFSATPLAFSQLYMIIHSCLNVLFSSTRWPPLEL